MPPSPTFLNTSTTGEEPIPNTSEHGPTDGQGSGLSSEERKAVENRAMALASAYYRQNWTVLDVSSRRSYDLLCTRANEELHVEVKGTTSGGMTILLTANEVAHARQAYPNVALFLVHGIELRSIQDSVEAYGGTVRVIEPWNIELSRLEATEYRCQLPEE